MCELIKTVNHTVLNRRHSLGISNISSIQFPPKHDIQNEQYFYLLFLYILASLHRFEVLVKKDLVNNHGCIICI